MPETRFQYKGDLSTSALPEVLETVHRYRVPGVLTVAHEGLEKKVYIWDGDVIFATSGDRYDSLGDYLLRNNRITQEQLDESVEELLLSGGERRHGQVLVDMGVLSSDDLFKIVTEQVKAIVDSVFDWDAGDVTFQVGQFKTDEEIQLAIPTRQAILEGVKHVRDARRLVSILGPSWTIFDPSYVSDEMQDLTLDVGEIRLLQQVDGTKTLRELITLGPGDAPHNAKVIYAFYALKLVARRDNTPRAIKKIQWKTAGGEFTTDGGR